MTTWKFKITNKAIAKIKLLIVTAPNTPILDKSLDNILGNAQWNYQQLYTMMGHETNWNLDGAKTIGWRAFM